MRLTEFVRQHREEIDRLVWNHTTHRYNSPQKLTTDKERIEWVINEEGLYHWAQQEVKGL